VTDWLVNYLLGELMARKVDKEKRQAELLETAIEVFAKCGYQATTMDEIAEQAGVSKGMLYIYFKNKEALFGAVFRWYGNIISETMQAAICDIDDEIEQLEQIAAVWGKIAIEHRDYVPLFLDFWAAASVKGMRSDYADDLAHMYEEYRTLIIEIIESGKKNGRFKQHADARAAAYLLVGGMDGIFIQSWLSQPQGLDKIVNQSMRMLLDGIRVQ